MAGVNIVVVQAGKPKTLWMDIWTFANYPLFFVKWWFRGFVPYLAQVVRRLVIGGWRYLSLGLLLRRFWAPWKNVDNIAGWFTGLGIKLIYFLVVFPIWLIYSIFLYILLIVIMFIWFIPLIIWFLKRSGTLFG